MNNKTHEFEQIVPLLLNSQTIPQDPDIRSSDFKSMMFANQRLNHKRQYILYPHQLDNKWPSAIVFLQQKCQFIFQDARDYFKNKRFEFKEEINNLAMKQINHRNYLKLNLYLTKYEKNRIQYFQIKMLLPVRELGLYKILLS
ncbi:unnamed protein product (macronuclear) [Paramecium tetraurelia]|uniref:Uncharacterized protein n=1 Tax=Paramecium tetraurelia TaxID=5888 RepID=A0BGD4_PARTE|nr:uncharacterized protein GSPATT00028636001 [Paramecium tetraurelia]CAK57601.1 unnamed protein product [Paramecium tetraurelia]|eukprot:XP_001424999.1 hypothetical protein (macronuclear) [Paramecium tetraurelia strain d4-2]